MGFKDVQGHPVYFTSIVPASINPNATLVGPRAGGVTSGSVLQGEGYVDITFPAGPQGVSGRFALNPTSVTDPTPKLAVVPMATGSTIAVDPTQAPIQIGGASSNTFRFWLKNVSAADVATPPRFAVLAQSVSYIDLSTGKTVFNDYGVTLDSNGNPVDGTVTPNSLAGAVKHQAYLDVAIQPSTQTPPATVDLTALATMASQVVVVLNQNGQPVPVAGALPLAGGTTLRILLADNTPFPAGTYSVTFPSNVYHDSSAMTANNAGGATTFSVVNPSAQVVGPFSAGSSTIDVNALNAAIDPTSGQHYVDVLYTPAPGTGLNYASILSPAAAVVTLTVGGTPVALGLHPIPITMTADANGILQPTAVSYSSSDPNLNATLSQAHVSRFRYLLPPGYTFPTGPIAVNVAPTWTDTAGDTPPADSENFVAEGPTAALRDPLPGTALDVVTLNGRGTLDATFKPALNETLKPSTITASVLALSGPGASGVTVANVAPTLVSYVTAANPQTIVTYNTSDPLPDFATLVAATYRFTLAGSFQPGLVTATFAAGGFGDTTGLKNATIAQTFTVSGPTAMLSAPASGGTIGLNQLNAQGYVSVLFTPVSGGTIDPASLSAGTLTLSGPGAGSVVFGAPVAQQDGVTFRFPFTGLFAPGAVTIEFKPGSFRSLPATGSAVANLDQSSSFTAVQLVGTLVNPVSGDTVNINQINNQSYFDVVYTVPSYASTLDVSSLTALGPQFTATGPATGSFAVDTSQVPVLVSSGLNGSGQMTYTVRYFDLGTDHSGNVAVNFIGGSLNYLDANGGTIPLFADEPATVATANSVTYVNVSFGSSTTLDTGSVTMASITIAGATITGVAPTATPGTYQFTLTGVSDGQAVTVHFVAGGVTYGGVSNSVQAGPASAPTLNGATYLDVRFTTYGSPIDPTSLIGREFTLGGVGADVLVGTTPLLVATGNGYQIYRYFITQAAGTTQVFPNKGTVTVQFNAGSWSDLNGNVNIGSMERFQLINRGPPPGVTDTTHQAFFIEVKGGVILNDPTGFISGTNPLVSVQGVATLTIDPIGGVSNGPVFLLDASGTLNVYRIGNLASGALHFVLDISPIFATPAGPPLLYGAIAIASNLNFLKSLGITIDASALLELNVTDQIQTVQLKLQGIPGDVEFDTYDTALLANPGALGSQVFGSVPLPAAWIAAFARGGITLQDKAPFAVLTQFDRGTPVAWTVHDGDNGAQYFIVYRPADAQAKTTAHFEIQSEIRTLTLQPFTFLIQLQGRAILADPLNPTGTPWFSLKGGFEILINPTGFVFFALANFEMASDSAVRIILLGVNPALAFVNQIAADVLFVINSGGIVGQIKLSFAASAGLDNFGLDKLNLNLTLSGSFSVVFNTTQRDFKFPVPQILIPVLPPGDSPLIDIPAAPAPVLVLYTDTDSQAVQAITATLPGAIGAPVAVPSGLLALFADKLKANRPLSGAATIAAAVLNSASPPLVLEWIVTDGTTSYSVVNDLTDPNHPILRIFDAPPRYRDDSPSASLLAALPTGALGVFGAIPAAVSAWISDPTRFGRALDGSNPQIAPMVVDAHGNVVEWQVNNSTASDNRTYVIQLDLTDAKNPVLTIVEQDGSIYLQIRVDGQLNLANALVLKGDFVITGQVVTTGAPTFVPLYTKLEVTGQASGVLLNVGAIQGLVDFTAEVGGSTSHLGFWGSADLELALVANPAITLNGSLKLLVNFSGQTRDILQFGAIDPNTGIAPVVSTPFAPGFLIQFVGEAIVVDPTNQGGAPWFSLKGAMQFKVDADGLEFFAAANLQLGNTSLVKYALLAAFAPTNPAIAALIASGNSIAAVALLVVHSNGVVGYLKLDFSASLGLSNLGIQIPNADMTSSTTLKIVFNATLQDFRFAIPDVFLKALTPGDPTVIDIPASPAPPFSLYTDANPTDAAQYLAALPTTLGVFSTVSPTIVSLFAGPVGHAISASAQVKGLVANDQSLVLEWLVVDGSKSYTIVRDLSNPSFATLVVADAPSGNPAIYLQLQLSGNLNLFNGLILKGQFDLTVEAVFDANTLAFLYIQGTMFGQVSATIPTLGSFNALLDLTFTLGSGTNNGFWGSVDIEFGATLIPGITIAGSFKLLVNASPTAHDLPIFVGDAKTGNVTIQTVSFAPGFEIALSGDLYAFGIVDLKGAFDFAVQFSPPKLTVKANASMVLAPIGSLAITGYLQIDSTGLVAYLSSTLDAGAGFGHGVGITLTGSFLLELNTTGQDTTFTDLFGATHVVHAGFLFALNGNVDFLGVASASGSITISISNNAFQMSFDIQFNLAGALTFHANGYAGIFNDGHAGLVLQLDVSFNVNVIGVFKVSAAGKLNLNTTDITRNANGTNISPSSLFLNVYGNVSILELFKFDASFTITVGPYVTAINNRWGSFPVALGYGGWSFRFNAGINFLGIATVNAGGFLDSRGDFDFYLNGGFSFGSIPWFGFQASFDGEVFVYNNPNGDLDLGVHIGGSGAAYVIGISVGASFSVDGFAANGSFSIVVSGSVSIGFWIFTIHIPFSFYIGTIQLPSPIHLGGTAGDPFANPANPINGTLYLNSGDRAYARNLGQGATTESWIIDPNGGDSVNGETVTITCFGRSQTFTGVRKIVVAGNGATAESVVIHAGVFVPVELIGGTAAQNNLVSDGSGPVVMKAGPMGDTLIAGNTVPAAVLIGGVGNDYLRYTGTGQAVITGGSGNDTIIAPNGSGANVLLGHGQVNSYNSVQIAYDLAHGINWTTDTTAVTYTQVINGATGYNIIQGNYGDDLIVSGPGNNLIQLPIAPITYSHPIVGGPDNTNLWLVGLAGANNFNATAASGTLTVTDGAATLQATNVKTLTLQGASGTNSFNVGNLAPAGVLHVVIDSGAGRSTAASINILGNVAPENFVLTEGDALAGSMTTLNIVGTDASTGVLVTDYKVINARRGLGDSLTLNGGAGPNTIDASNLGGPVNTALPSSGINPDMTQLILVGGTAGGNTLIASPYNDTLDPGPGANNVIVIQRGVYNFVAPTGSVAALNNTLVVNTDVDVALFNDTLVMGALLQDTGTTPYGQGEGYPSEAALGASAAATPGATYAPNSRGRRFVAGATVENLKNIFNNAIINRVQGNGAIVLDGYNTTVTVGTATLTVAPWVGATATINSQPDPGGRIQRDIINLAQNPAVTTLFNVVGNGVGAEVLSVYGTPVADSLTLGTATTNGVTNATIAVAGSSGSQIAYRGLSRVLIQTLGGADTYQINDTTTPTVLNLGGGANGVVIGSNPTVNNGTSNPLYLFGGGGNNSFEIDHNLGPIAINGGTGSNTYLVNASPDTNGPLTISGGTGTEALTFNSRPGSDTLVITANTIAGAGRSLTFTNLQAITVNDNGGSDAFWVMNVNANTTLTIGAQSGNDSIQVEGNVPAVTFTPPAYTATPAASTANPPATVYTQRTINLSGFTFQVNTQDWGNTTANFNGDTTATANYYLNRILNGFYGSWGATYPGFAVTSTVIQNLSVVSVFNVPSYNTYDQYQQVTVGTLLVNYRTGVSQSQSSTIQAGPASFQPASYTYAAPEGHDTATIIGHLIILGSTNPNNADAWTVDDTGNSAGNTGTLTDTTLSGINTGPLGITYGNIATTTINLGTGANSFSISVPAGKNLALLTNLNGGPNPANVLTSAAWATDQNGVLNVTGFPSLPSMTLGGNLNGQVTLFPPNTVNALAIGGSISPTGVLNGQNIVNGTIAHDMAGLINLSNNLTSLTIGGASPGLIVADGAIGTISAAALTGAVALKIREAGVPRQLEVNPTAAGGASPVFGALYQSSLAGIPLTPAGNPLSPGGLASPQLFLNQTSPNAGPFDLNLAAYNYVPAVPATNPPTKVTTGHSATSKFNLSYFNDASASGVRDISVEGDLLTALTAQAKAYFNLPSSAAGGIRLPQDNLGGVGVRDYAAPNSILAKSLQSVAFGQFLKSGVVITNYDPTKPAAQRTVASTTDAYNILNASTARAISNTTYHVAVGPYPVIQYLTTTTNNVFDPNFLLLSNQFGIDSQAVSEGLTMNAPVMSNVTTTAVNGRSNVTAVNFVGDGGSLLTAQWVNGPITSTGPLGDLTLAATQGITGTITAPRIFGSIVAQAGPIAATATIETTGLRIDPLSGVVTADSADFGQMTYNATSKAWTDSTISGRGLIAGRIISRGDLISQVTTNGNLTGLVAAVGNIGGNGAAATGTTAAQPARFGGVAVTGTTSGQILTLADILGDLSTTNLVGGRIAAAGSILGNVTVTSTFNANSAIVAGGKIGNPAGGTVLNVYNPAGIIAARGAVTFGKTGSLAGASVFSNLSGTDANTLATLGALNTVFADGAGHLLTSFDDVGTDLVNLTSYLVKDLGKLHTATGFGGIKVLSDN